MKINEVTNLASNLIDQAKICQRAFKKTHGELDKQNPFHSIINSIHWDKIIFYQISEIINELGMVEREHDLNIEES